MSRLATALLAAVALQGAPALAPSNGAAPAAPALPMVIPNDNRVAAGTARRGVRHLSLVAQRAAWRPDASVDSTVTVMAFAEAGGAPRIPGPLLRVTAGTEVRVTLRNALPDSVLVVHGLRAGAVPGDTLQLRPGATREVRFVAAQPGTWLYWGSTTGMPIHERRLRDGQLSGAIVVDARGARPDTAERIFVMTVIDYVPDDTVRNKAKEDIWELAINGRSWPHTERLTYAVGDTVRWRWINASYLPHPMHLHGFHFRVTAKGDGPIDSTYAPAQVRDAVTEFMRAGTTFRMEWVPTRAGNWLMHCHMLPHVTPYPERPDSAHAHDLHDVARHPVEGMAGLVLGITTVDRAGARAASATPTRHLRLFVQQAPADSGKAAPRGYVLQRGAAPRADSVEVPGTPLVLVRGETTAITVVNRLREATTVHWHGMELESVYDGVSGWSRSGSNMAPLLAPGDSFTVAFTPPRAGTFMYHTHMDEGAQLRTGMYGPLIVVEPGARWDPATDLTFMLGGAVDSGRARPALNGRRRPPPIEVRAGTTYRLRLANILFAPAARVELVADSVPLAWRPLAKDGADLPPALRVVGPARLRHIGPGETFDYAWTPERAGEAALVLHTEGGAIRQVLRVLPAAGRASQ